MKIPVPVFLAVLALFIVQGSCLGGTETLGLKTSASPSTFTKVGDTINFTYTADADSVFVTSKGYTLIDPAADSKPACSYSTTTSIGENRLICKATHTITAEDVALGYVTSQATVDAFVSTKILFGFTGKPVDLTANATTVVYIENFAPSPTPTLTPVVTATPIATDTPIATATSTATPDLSPNAEVIFEKGNTADLVSCSGTEFAFKVKDPEGVKQVYVEFAVAGFDTDFSNIAATLDLANNGGDTWSGVFNDTISTIGQVTYWRVVVVDNNDVKTVYYEEGKFSFYARDKSCK